MSNVFAVDPVIDYSVEGSDGDVRDNSNLGTDGASAGGPVVAGGDSHAPPPRAPHQGADRVRRGDGGAAPRLDSAWDSGCLAVDSEPATRMLTDPGPGHEVGLSASGGPRSEAVTLRAETCGMAESDIAISACQIRGQDKAPGIGCERGGLPGAARNVNTVSDARLGTGAIRGRSKALGAYSDVGGGTGPAAERHGEASDSHESARRTKRLHPADGPAQASAKARLEALRRRVATRSLRTAVFDEEFRCRSASGGGQNSVTSPREEEVALEDGAAQHAASSAPT